MNRVARWALLSVGLAGVITATAIFVAAGSATPPVGLTNLQLGRGTFPAHAIIPLAGTDVVMSQITVNPGGSSGWHSHPGGAIIVVAQGTLTKYHGTTGHGRLSGHCEITPYSAGQAFTEAPGEVDQVVNTGTSPYILYVTFPLVPQGGATRIDQPDPGTCPGV
jgi:quercetin dioxygenase-like cupin family protein